MSAAPKFNYVMPFGIFFLFAFFFLFFFAVSRSAQTLSILASDRLTSNISYLSHGSCEHYSSAFLVASTIDVNLVAGGCLHADGNSSARRGPISPVSMITRECSCNLGSREIFALFTRPNQREPESSVT